MISQALIAGIIGAVVLICVTICLVIARCISSHIKKQQTSHSVSTQPKQTILNPQQHQPIEHTQEENPLTTERRSIPAIPFTTYPPPPSPTKIKQQTQQQTCIIPPPSTSSPPLPSYEFSQQQQQQITFVSNLIGKEVIGGPPLNRKYKFEKLTDQEGGNIYEASTPSENGQAFLIKAVNKLSCDQKTLQRLEEELQVVQRLNHKNVIGLIEKFETDQCIFLVFPWLSGGELFDRIAQRGNFTEEDAISVLRQILEGIKYLHSNPINVCHRDLKPENLLYRTMAEDSDIVITDFSLSKVFPNDETQLMHTQCGTIMYVAPEVLTCQEGYTKSCDMWSLGCISFILLTGSFPFDDTNPIVSQIVGGNWDREALERTPGISQLAKDFVSRLLVCDPKQRMAVEEALKHPWLNTPNLSLSVSIDLKNARNSLRHKRKSSQSSISLSSRQSP